MAGTRQGMVDRRSLRACGAAALCGAWALAWPGLGLAQGVRAAGQPAADPAAPREWRYRVAPGDTLIGLAAAHFTDPEGWPALQRLNQVVNPRRLVPGSIMRMPYAWLRRESAVAEVVFVQGQVSLLRAGTEPPPALKVGDRLQAADSLRTAPGASLSLRFADGTRLLVAPDSQVTLERLLVYGRSGIVDTRLRLDQGGADSQVRPNAAGSPAYELRSPAVNLGVRGTEFRVRMDAAGAATRVEVLDGSVAAGRGVTGPGQADGGMLVAAGFGTVAAPDRPVAAPRPLLAAPRLALQELVFEDLAFGLDWAPVAGARGYRAQVLADSEVDALLRDGLFDGTTARWADIGQLPDGRYRWRVRALDEAGLEGLDTTRHFVIAARPLPPPPRQPAPGELVPGGRVSLAWTESAGAAAYRVQVAQQGDFSQPLADQRVEGLHLSLPLPQGTYQWRVAAVPTSPATRPHGPFGPPQAFELRDVPPLPVMEPAQLAPNRLLLRWKPLAAGQGAQVQVARDEAFRDLLIDQPTEGAELALPRPASGTYHWRLRSMLAGRPVGEFSQAEALSVPGLGWWDRLWLGRPPTAD